MSICFSVLLDLKMFAVCHVGYGIREGTSLLIVINALQIVFSNYKMVSNKISKICENTALFNYVFHIFKRIIQKYILLYFPGDIYLKTFLPTNPS